MAKYQFNYTVTPSGEGYWIDIRNQKDAISADTLDEAIDKFVKLINDRWGVTISKTARKRPQIMCYEHKDGPTKEVGRVFKASMEIDFGDGSSHADYRRKGCDVWTEVYEMTNVFLKAA
jgi:hypothetical protein